MAVARRKPTATSNENAPWKTAKTDRERCATDAVHRALRDQRAEGRALPVPAVHQRRSSTSTSATKARSQAVGWSASVHRRPPARRRRRRCSRRSTSRSVEEEERRLGLMMPSSIPTATSTTRSSTRRCRRRSSAPAPPASSTILALGDDIGQQPPRPRARRAERGRLRRRRRPPARRQDATPGDISMRSRAAPNRRASSPIGEIGLDFYRNLSPRDVQHRVLPRAARDRPRTRSRSSSTRATRTRRCCDVSRASTPKRSRMRERDGRSA